MHRIFTAFLMLILLSACGGTSSNSNDAPLSANPAPAAAGVSPYPSISVELMQSLWNNTTTVDYLFYELPISMNMVEKSAIQNTLRQISDQPAQVQEKCKPMGRVFFQNNGATLAEADFYFMSDCTYFIFMENQKPVHSNQMTREGITFFQNLLNSASQGQ